MAENGTILTKRELDRETISTYNLVVTARDCARQPEKRLSSTVQVIIFFFVSLFVRKYVVSLEQSIDDCGKCFVLHADVTQLYNKNIFIFSLHLKYKIK